MRSPARTRRIRLGLVVLGVLIFLIQSYASAVGPSKVEGQIVQSGGGISGDDLNFTWAEIASMLWASNIRVNGSFSLGDTLSWSADDSTLHLLRDRIMATSENPEYSRLVLNDTSSPLTQTWLTFQKDGLIRNQIRAGAVYFGDEVVLSFPGEWPQSTRNAFMLNVNSDLAPVYPPEHAPGAQDTPPNTGVVVIAGHMNRPESPLIIGQEKIHGVGGFYYFYRTALYQDKLLFGPSGYEYRDNASGLQSGIVYDQVAREISLQREGVEQLSVQAGQVLLTDSHLALGNAKLVKFSNPDGSDAGYGTIGVDDTGQLVLAVDDASVLAFTSEAAVFGVDLLPEPAAPGTIGSAAAPWSASWVGTSNATEFAFSNGWSITNAAGGEGLVVKNAAGVVVFTLSGDSFVRAVASTLPACDASVRGTSTFLGGGDGEADRVYLCMKAVDGSFSWKLQLQG